MITPSVIPFSVYLSSQPQANWIWHPNSFSSQANTYTGQRKIAFVKTVKIEQGTQDLVYKYQDAVCYRQITQFSYRSPRCLDFF